MQYIIEINHEQDLPFLLMLLEKLQVSYKPIDLPKKKTVNHTLIETETSTQPVVSLADKYFGKMSDETAKALLAHIEESRNEREHDIY